MMCMVNVLFIPFGNLAIVFLSQGRTFVPYPSALFLLPSLPSLPYLQLFQISKIVLLGKL